MRWKTRDWIRGLLSDKIQPQHLISSAYKENLRFMLASFSGFKIRDPQNELIDVPCVNATAERAVAKMFQENNIILPLVTVAQTLSDEDTERRRIKDLLVNETYWDTKRKRALRVISLAPKAITISYEVNMWTKYNEDMDQLVEQIRLLLNPNLTMITKYTNSTMAFITGEENDSVTVVGDREDRIIRRRFDLSVEGYIPYPKYLITSTGEITEFNTEVEVITENKTSVLDETIDTSSINISETESYTKIN
jgi:hypothetical protein